MADRCGMNGQGDVASVVEGSATQAGGLGEGALVFQGEILEVSEFWLNRRQ